MHINPHFSPEAFRGERVKSLLPGGMVVSGRRYYCPSQGRFLGRDTKGEKGGLHLYAFCLNDAINRWDVLGQYATWRVDLNAGAGADGADVYKLWVKYDGSDPGEEEAGDFTSYDAAAFAGTNPGVSNSASTGAEDQAFVNSWASFVGPSDVWINPAVVLWNAQNPFSSGNPTAAAITPQSFPSTQFPFYQLYGQGTCTVETARNIAFLLTGKSTSDKQAIEIAAQLSGQTADQIIRSGVQIGVAANIVNVIGGAASVSQTNSLENFTNLVKDGQPIGIVVPNPTGGAGTHAVTVQYNSSTGNLTYINSWATFDYRTGSYTATVTSASITEVYNRLKSTYVVVGIPVTTTPPGGG